MVLQVSQVLDGKFRILRLVGEGGMGAVYEAQHEFLGRRVAIKVLGADFAHNAEAVRRFYREAQAAARIGHENICEVTDIGQTGGSPYIVMQLLQGKSLAQAIVESAPFPVGRTVDIAQQALEALAAAHAAGIVHRDMKPDNVFLTRSAGRDDFVKLLDFGISKVRTSGGGTKLTQDGTVLGTPQYMSPEQARGEMDVDGRADVWAVGIIVYEMLTGRIPFEGANYNQIIFNVVAGPIPRLRALREGITSELEAVVMHSLERDVGQRFPTALAFRDALLGAWMGTGESGFAVQATTSMAMSLGDDATEISPGMMLAHVAADRAAAVPAPGPPQVAIPPAGRAAAAPASQVAVAGPATLSDLRDFGDIVVPGGRVPATGPATVGATTSSPSGIPTTPKGMAAARLAQRGTVQATPGATVGLPSIVRATAQPPPRRRVPLVPVLISAFAAVAIVVFLIVRPFGSSGENVNPDAGQVAAAPADAGLAVVLPAAVPAVVDAAVVEVPKSPQVAVQLPDVSATADVSVAELEVGLAAKELDAGTATSMPSERPAEATPQDARAGPSVQPPADAARPTARAPTGTLTVVTSPTVQLQLDGESIGRSPIFDREVAVGPHTIVFVNESQGVRRQERMVVIEGRNTEIRRNAEQLGVVRQPVARDGGTVAAPRDAGTASDGIRIRRRDAQ